jgi:Fe-S-cluster-containing hydrogenase component 2
MMPFHRKATVASASSHAAETEGKLSVNLRRCPQNHPCPSINVCPTGALSQKGFEAPTVDDDACVACGRCVNYCPMRALSLSA